MGGESRSPLRRTGLPGWGGHDLRLAWSSDPRRLVAAPAFMSNFSQTSSPDGLVPCWRATSAAGSVAAVLLGSEHLSAIAGTYRPSLIALTWTAEVGACIYACTAFCNTRHQAGR